MSIARSHGHDIFYVRAGEGPAIVFVHGTNGNASLWLEQFDAFAGSNTCIAYDHRGFGRSVGPPSEFKPEYFADDVCAILDAEGVERCVIVCSSLGGWTGTRFALERPERLAGLVVCNSTASIDVPVAFEAAEESKPRAEVQGALAVAVSPRFIAEQPVRAYYLEQVLGSAAAPEHQLDWQVVYERIMTPSALTNPDRLASVRCKSLHIAGDLDLIFPPRVIKAVADRFPNSVCVSMPDVAHCPWFEAPEAFNAILCEFLRELNWQRRETSRF